MERVRGACTVLCLVASACGSAPGTDGNVPGSLAPLPSRLLRPLVAYAEPLVQEGRVGRLALVRGALPQGLALGELGVHGVPRISGEIARFTIGAWGPDGVPAGTRDYVLAVGAQPGDLPGPPSCARQGDLLQIEANWGRPIATAFAWDAALGLIWPLAGGPGVSGRALAPGGAILTVVAAGAASEGQFDIPVAPLAASVALVAQLRWDGDADLDLVLVPDRSSGAAELTPGAAELVVGGAIAGRHLMASGSAVDVEALVVEAGLPEGRHRLAVVKKGGAAVEVAFDVALRRRDGASMFDGHFDGLFSDTATGSIADESAARRQSYRIVGEVVRAPDDAVTFQRAP